MAFAVNQDVRAGRAITIEVENLAPLCFAYRFSIGQARSSNGDEGALQEFAKKFSQEVAQNPDLPPPNPGAARTDEELTYLERFRLAKSQLDNAIDAITLSDIKLAAANASLSDVVAAAEEAGCRGRGQLATAWITAEHGPIGSSQDAGWKLQRAEGAAAELENSASSLADLLAERDSRTLTDSDVSSAKASLGLVPDLLEQHEKERAKAYAGLAHAEAVISIVRDASLATQRMRVPVATDADSIAIVIVATRGEPLASGGGDGDGDKAAASEAIRTDTIWVPTVRDPPRVTISTGYMVGAMRSPHYVEAHLPMPDSATATYRTFVNANGGTHAGGPALLANIRVLGPLHALRTGMLLAATLGTTVRSVNNDQELEWMGGASLGFADLFFVTAGVHYGRREILLIGSPDDVRKAEVSADITRDGAVGVRWGSSFMLALSVKLK